MHLALSGLDRARWTTRIHDEGFAALLKRRPDLSVADLNWTRAQMDSAVPDCLVTDWEALEAGLVLPDPSDCHVLAAAIRCQAGAIVTYNTRDFPESALRQFGITAQHPDEFVEHRSEEHTSELQSLMRISYAVFCLQKQKKTKQ